MSTVLDCWNEWRERCALGLCGQQTQDALRRFAYERFQRYLIRYTQARLGTCQTASAHEAWHRFETHAIVPGARAAKCYKNWLFARVQSTHDNPFDVVQGGATLLMRDVVRDYLRQESSRDNTTSLNAPVQADGSSELTLQDLLPGDPDPRSEVELREFLELARHEAERFIPTLDRKERVSVIAKSVGVSLAHPVVEAQAGCRKSVLNQAYRDLLARLCTQVRAAYPNEENASVLMIIECTVEEVRRTLCTARESEKTLAEFFSISRGGIAHGTTADNPSPARARLAEATADPLAP